jgi:hypothetical protein
LYWHTGFGWETGIFENKVSNVWNRVFRSDKRKITRRALNMTIALETFDATTIGPVIGIYTNGIESARVIHIARRLANVSYTSLCHRAFFVSSALDCV